MKKTIMVTGWNMDKRGRDWKRSQVVIDNRATGDGDQPRLWKQKQKREDRFKKYFKHRQDRT